ncbi:MAG TPA: ribonuclease P protein component [Xanthobacteraceae bacterium]|nr:ribonuclease P protein component [Xanthobacteraceae bacterium]
MLEPNAPRDRGAGPRSIKTFSIKISPNAGLPNVGLMERLKRRSDFRAAAQAAARGARASARAFVLQARRRAEAGPPRIGFTISKQVGNAVERNRVRRRLRALVRGTPAESLSSGHDYVLVGRRAALKARFGDMMQDLAAALHRVHGLGKTSSSGTGTAANQPPHRTGSPGRKRLQVAGRPAADRNTSNLHLPGEPPQADSHEH